MSLPRLWMSVVVAGALLACAHDHNPRFTAMQTSDVAQTHASAGGVIYQEWGCGTCHGAKGEGTSQGPAFTNLAAHWRRETLNRYLRAPHAFQAQDERLQQLAKKYAPISMPAFDGLDSLAVANLVDYLLNEL
ncbi:cytochrome c [candidate division KSB1 bacterium]|nr:MAG: cytochrome c [candidate division KSB1 bacterium]MCE7944165.1 cytochrome c [Chlorobi bacterium CHB1]MDL1878654.1 cytochrome c [Cytophagia bacterium CHB2]